MSIEIGTVDKRGDVSIALTMYTTLGGDAYAHVNKAEALELITSLIYVFDVTQEEYALAVFNKAMEVWAEENITPNSNLTAT